MTRLQGLQTSKRMLVTLNPDKDPEGLISEYAYEHPMFTSEAVTKRPGLKNQNGKRRTWFAGSYFGNGFHEDAVRSSVEVAEGFSLEL